MRVEIETSSGRTVETLLDPTGVLDRILPAMDNSDYPYLGVIDRYGDTIFNYLQVPHFLDELRRLPISAAVDDAAPFLGRLRSLAEVVERDRLYLRFTGD